MDDDRTLNLRLKLIAFLPSLVPRSHDVSSFYALVTEPFLVSRKLITNPSFVLSSDRLDKQSRL
jgi:hypothetical protein